MALPRIPGPVPFVDKRHASYASVTDGPLDTHRMHASVLDECCPEVEGPEMVAPSPYGVALAQPEAPVDIDADVPLPFAAGMAPGMESAAPATPDGFPPPDNPLEDELLRGMLGAPRPMAPLGQGR